MMGDVTIRIWNGCEVRMVLSVSPTGHTVAGSVGGAANGANPDIELDPWAGLVVDHRSGNPTPVALAGPDEE